MKSNNIIKITCILFVFFLSSHTLSQTISGYYTTRQDSLKLCAMLYNLRHQNLTDIPKLFFDKTHDDELPDMIMFIEDPPTKTASANVKIELIKGNKKREQLYGEQYLYVLVFWAKNENSQHFFTESCVTGSLSALEQKQSSGEFALISALRLIAEACSGKNFESKKESELKNEINKKAKIIELGKYDKTTLYYMFFKFPLHENTINRVHVWGNNSNNTCQAIFGNYSPSWVTSSVGFLASYACCKSEKETNVLYPVVDPYLFGHLYFKRPQVPRPRLNNTFKEWKRQISLSAVVGTKLSDKLLEDFFMGASLGHVLNKFSIVTGVSFHTISVNDEKERKTRISCGLTYML